MEMYNHNLEIMQINGPEIHMLIEPETKYRFRYASEGGSHGGLAGRDERKKEEGKAGRSEKKKEEGKAGRSEKKKKLYPTVQLANYNGSSNDIFIRVSLCTEKRTDHVLQFKGKKTSEYRSYVDANLDDDFRAVFKDLTILIPKKEDVHQALLNRKIKSLGRNLSKSARDKFERDHKEDIKKEAKEIFNSVVLKFDAYKHARPNDEICPSRYSDPICNQKDSSKGELKICRMSKVAGSCKGEEEVILLCEKVQKDNVKIKFYELDGNDNRWEAYATFSPSDVHYQVAISFKTPPYKYNMEKTVAVCLERGGEMSEHRFFTYIPEDCPSKKRKKWEFEETMKQMSSPMGGSSPSSSAGAIQDNIGEGIWEHQDLLDILPKFSSDSNSSSQDLGQQDQDDPSKELGHEFLNQNQLDIATFLFSGSVDDFMFEDTANQDIACQGIDYEDIMPQSLPVEIDLTSKSYFPKMDIGGIVGKMTSMMSWHKCKDSGSNDEVDRKIEGQMAVMDLKDSGFNNEIHKIVFKNESKSKILIDEQKKLKLCLPLLARRDRHGNTLLHLAVLHNKSIKRILQVIKMSNSDFINAQNKDKQTALHIAVEKNSAVVKELLLNSANPSIKNDKGNNCCHIACEHDFIKCLEYIFNPRRCHVLILDDFNYEGLTPLHVALKNNSLSCLDFLFSQCYHLIDFNAVDHKHGQSFLHYAVAYSPSFVSRLLSEKEFEINCRDFDGNTPLHIACAKRNSGLVRILMEAGADAGIRNSKHNGSNSDEEGSADNASVGQTPADLTTDSNILNLLKYENPSDDCHGCSSDDCISNDEDKESARIFEELSKDLSTLLDTDKRWKVLAMYFLDEEYVTGLEKCNQNPTRTVLEYIKKTLGKEYIEQLLVVLGMVGFNDAAKVTMKAASPSL